MTWRLVDDIDSGEMARERNTVRETLRTPGFTSIDSQEAWIGTINKPDSPIWYWVFFGGVSRIGYGGLVNIDRWNRSAELAVLVCEQQRKKGYGRKIVDWLIAEAFDRQNLHKVWAEVYACNPAFGFWDHYFGESAFKSRRVDQKYWDGQYYDSYVYDLINPRD